MNINVTKTAAILICLLGLLVPLAIAFNAASEVVGTWNCTSTKTPLGDLAWNVSIKEDGGKLLGTAACEELGTFRLSEIKLDENAFSFVFYPSGNHVLVKTAIKQGSMTGTWEMEGGSAGEFKGTKTKD